MPPDGECLAKGVWFVTARRVLLDEHGQEALDRVVHRLGEGASGPLLSPYASEWYPEEALQRTMEAVSLEVCSGDPDRFCAFIESCTRLRYAGFPFFDDGNYRILVRGILRKTMEIASGERPDVTVRDYARDRLAVDVFFPTRTLRDA